MATEQKKFAYPLRSRVQLRLSGEVGIVIGRAEYSESADQYFVRYLAADGRQVEAWWNEEAISE